MEQPSQASHEEDHHAHSPHLAHHFDDEVQQFDSGKQGMWLFLTTEILLFAGLFCAYAMLRANYPEIFAYGEQHLDTKWGAINTGVLIFSSFTMAWAVRAAQINKQKLLVNLLAITLACGFIFLGVKFVEYKAKFEHGTLWGTLFNPHSEHGDGHGEDAAHGDDGDHAAAEGESHGESGDHGVAAATAAAEHGSDSHGDEAVAMAAELTPTPDPMERSDIADAPQGPSGIVTDTGEDAHHGYEGSEPPDKAWIFFGIYFVMTGLHGVHVIAGMAVIAWLLVRATKGHFGSQYYTPVDLGGLYWHLVDLIWIYLFPLLYLIH